MRVKVFTVTKNETDLIEDFVTYHGTLFGYDNVVVIDNNSDCPIVLDLYKKFRKQNVTIEYHDGYSGDSQGNAFTRSMLRHKSSCDFMMGIDTDEFVQVPRFLEDDPETLTAPLLRQRFGEYFKNLPKDASKFIISKYYVSVPNPKHPRYVEQKIPRPATDIIHFREEEATPNKCFFRSSTFMSTTNGCHRGRVCKGSTMESNLAYVHYHNTGARRSVERSMVIIEGYRYTSTTSDPSTQLKDLMGVKSPIGRHRVLEYARFLSRTLILSDMVSQKTWPASAHQLDDVSRDFPTLRGVSVRGGRDLPSNWEEQFEEMVFHDDPVSAKTRKSSIVRNVLARTGFEESPRNKIALMISGHLRNFAKRTSFWEHFVREFPEVDIYVHTWSDGGNRAETEWIDVGSRGPDLEEASRVLKPVKMVVEDHEKLFDSFSFQKPDTELYYTYFKKIETTDDFTRCIGSQLYSVQKCYELAREGDYDVFVRLRGDSVIDNFENLVGKDVPDDAIVINGSDHHVHPGGGRGCRDCDFEFRISKRVHHDHSNDVCDVFYYGKRKAMERLCGMFGSVGDLVSGFQEHNRVAVQKKHVKRHLKKFGNVTTIRYPPVYENDVKCFYPERLIREHMRDYWLVSDPCGLVPRIFY